MQGLRVISKDGSALTGEEIDAAHRFANTFGDKNIGVVKTTDALTEVEIEYHSFKRLVIVQSDISAYFGYASAVQMRCWCKKLVINFSHFGGILTNSGEGNFYANLSDGTFILSGEYSWSGSNGLAAFGAWGGGSTVKIYTRNFGQYVATSHPIEVPNLDRVCYSKGNAPLYPLGMTEPTKLEWISSWNADQALALEREYVRRKRCSDGQIMYLRNGFLSPEIEYFIKTQHPVSGVVKRKMPMEIVNTNYVLVSDTTEGAARTRIYSADVTLGYQTIDVDNKVTDNEQTLSGTVKLEGITHTGPHNELLLTNRYTFVDFPMLKDSGGKTYLLPSPLPNLPYSTVFKYDAARNIWHDDADFPLMVIANGIFNDCTWKTDNQFGAPNYPLHTFDGTPYEPPVLSALADNLTFTHSRFFLDYIADSKPIEIKDGELASSDWLSSRLLDKEIVTIIPLSFVNADDVDRGMFPFDRTDEVPTKIKLHGYAKFQFDYLTGTFTFKHWMEFTEQEKIKITADTDFKYNDETSPTQLTVRNSAGNSATYNLSPRLLDYNEAWAIPNCVCIAGKLIWSDSKAAAKTQKTNISDNPPVEYALTNEERLYHEVRKAIANHD